jgi:hypothetical protein
MVRRYDRKPGDCLRHSKVMARVERIVDWLCDPKLVDAEDLLDPSNLTRKIRETFGVGRRSSYHDARHAWTLLSDMRAEERELRRRRAVAEWERRERRADAAGELQAANFALDRKHRLEGLYPAAKLEVSGGIAVVGQIDVRIDALIGVLDDAGRAALAIVTEQLERARVAGMLPAPSDEPDAADETERDEDPPADAPPKKVKYRPRKPKPEAVVDEAPPPRRRRKKETTPPP